MTIKGNAFAIPGFDIRRMVRTTPDALADAGVILPQTLHYVRFALALVRPVGVFAATFGAVVMLGYIFDLEVLYRPIIGGPATNPLTALSIVMLGLGLSFCSIRSKTRVQLVFALVAMVLTAARLVDGHVYVTGLSALLTPFQSAVEAQLAAGKSNAMGLNSAWTLFLVSLSLLFRSLNRPAISQAFAFAALSLPMMAITGYAYGLDNFYGQMSMMTASLGVFLSVSSLAMTAHRGVLRALLSPYIGGRIARLQIILGYVVPFLLGFLLVRTLVHSGGVDMFGLFVVMISWFIIILVAYSAVVQERVDHQRRIAERTLITEALQDPLTKLPNRRQFLQSADRELQRCMRKEIGDDLWVLMIDVDHFKSINDTAGHATGDRVLAQVGTVLADTVRRMDLVARVGGEEFAVMLLCSSSYGVIRVAEDIRRNIEGMSVEGWTDVQGKPVTVSIGCASATDRSDLKSLFAAADEALYRAKESGRNRVSFGPAHVTGLMS